MSIDTIGHKRGSVITKRKLSKVIMITVLAVMLGEGMLVEAAESDEIPASSETSTEEETDVEGQEMEDKALVHVELSVPEGFSDPVDISLTRDEQSSYDLRLLPWEDYKEDIYVREGVFRLSGMVTSDILCRYYTIHFQSIDFVIEAGSEKTISAVVVPVTSNVETAEVKSQEEQMPVQTDILQAEEEEMSVLQEEEKRSVVDLILPVTLLYIAIVAGCLWARKGSYNTEFTRVMNIAVIVASIFLVAFYIACATSHFKNGAVGAGESVDEKIETGLNLESASGSLNQEEPDKEAEEEEKTASKTLVLGEHTLYPVYAGKDSYYGVYGYAGSLFKPSYDSWKTAKDADTTEPDSTDEWTGRSIRTIAGTKYIYSGVVRVNLDENGKIPVDLRLGFRNEDGYWTPCYMDKEEYNKNMKAFEEGYAVLQGGDWEEGTILCNGMLVSQPYVMEEGRYWIPIETLIGKIPYEIGVNDAGDAYIQYEYTQAVIKGGSGETYTVASNDYWEGVDTYSIDAYTAKSVNGEVYVEAETVSRLFGFDMYVGDGLLVISSGPYDQVKAMYLYPLHWDGEYSSSADENQTATPASEEGGTDGQ